MKYFVGGLVAIVILGGGMWWIIGSDNFSSHIGNERANTGLRITHKVVEIIPDPEVTLLFGGDVMLSRGINQVMLKRSDFSFPFRLIQTLTTEADIAVINLESSISSKGKNQGSIYSFRADPRAVEGLVFAGIDVVTLANNHAGDYGADALTDTFKLLADAKISIVGVGENMAQARAPLIIETKGIKVAFLGATPIAPMWLTMKESTPAVAPLAEKTMREDIEIARAQGADIVVVLLHWGNEYETKHNEIQEILAHSFIDAGATMVIGHHPHVVQEVERYKGGLIAYSLGNFVFDQNFSEDTRRGLLLKITVQKNKITNVKEIPIYFPKEYQPTVIP